MFETREISYKITLNAIAFNQSNSIGLILEQSVGKSAQQMLYKLQNDDNIATHLAIVDSIECL